MGGSRVHDEILAAWLYGWKHPLDRLLHERRIPMRRRRKMKHPWGQTRMAALVSRSGEIAIIFLCDMETSWRHQLAWWDDISHKRI